MRWALRAIHEPLPYPQEDKELWIERLRRRGIGAEIDDFDWPETSPFIRSVAVDGHGHVYVLHWGYPVVREDDHRVDVYNWDGRRLFSGPIVGSSFPYWTAVEDPLAAGAEEARANPCWEDDWILDAFGPDGRYLGEVEVPEELAPFELYMVVRGDMVVAVTMDDAGVIRVKRYRLVVPADRPR